MPAEHAENPPKRLDRPERRRPTVGTFVALDRILLSVTLENSAFSSHLLNFQRVIDTREG